MSIKCKLVQGLYKNKTFASPHAMMLTAISTPLGDAIEIEYESRSYQIAYSEIEALMQKAKE